jgi:hypothetical protein
MELDTQQIVREQLSAGERLLWSGRPKQGILFRGSDGFMIPFSIVWGGFAIFWTFGAQKANAPLPFWGFGLIFVCVGLYMIVGRFFVDMFQRGKTYYGLSDHRAIIISGIFGRTVKSLNLRSISDATLSEKGNGEGTITFGPTNYMTTWAQGMPWPGMSQNQVPTFERIENAKSVYEMIRKAQLGDR